jgi:hypothetical protein
MFVRATFSLPRELLARVGWYTARPDPRWGQTTVPGEECVMARQKRILLYWRLSFPGAALRLLLDYDEIRENIYKVLVRLLVMEMGRSSRFI